MSSINSITASTTFRFYQRSIGLALAGSTGAVAGSILGGAASAQWGVRRNQTSPWTHGRP